MNADRMKSDLTDGDGSWESLAEDLLGIDCRQDDCDEEPVLPDEETIKQEIVGQAVAGLEADQGALSAEPSRSISQTFPGETGDVQDSEPKQDVLSAPIKVSQEKKPELAESDSYWNGLESWESDQDGAQKDGAQKDGAQKAARRTERSKKGRSGRESVVRPPSPKSSTSDDLRAEKTVAHDDNFGLGVLETDTKQLDSEQKSSSADQPTLHGTAKEVSDRGTDELPAATKQQQIFHRSSEQHETPESSDRAVEADLSMESTSFAAGLFEESAPRKEVAGVGADADGGKTRRKRRRRRSSKQRQKPDLTQGVGGAHSNPAELESAVDSATGPAECDTLGSEMDDIEPVDGKRSPANTKAYRDIPTWGEAISHLLGLSLVGKQQDEVENNSNSLPKKEGSRANKSANPSSRKGRRRR